MKTFEADIMEEPVKYCFICKHSQKAGDMLPCRECRFNPLLQDLFEERKRIQNR